MDLMSKKFHIMGHDFDLYGRLKDEYFSYIKSPHRDEILRVAKYVVKENDTVLDIGGNIGVTTLYFSRHARNGRVLTCEPGSTNFETMVCNVQSNSCKNVNVVNCAVGSSDGTLKFFESAEVGSGSFALSDQSVSAAELYDDRLIQIEVKLRSVDSLVREHGLNQVDFIKIDVEGAEKSVIEGAKETLARFKPSVLLEFNSLNQIMYQDQSPLGFLKYIKSVFDELYWVDRGSGKLVLVSGDVGINHFLIHNLQNGFVDNFLATFSSRGITDGTVPQNSEPEHGFVWTDEGSASSGTVSRKDYDWLLGEVQRHKVELERCRADMARLEES